MLFHHCATKGPDAGCSSVKTRETIYCLGRYGAQKENWVFFTSGPNDQFVVDTCMPLLEQVSGMKEQKDYKVAFTGI